MGRAKTEMMEAEERGWIPIEKSVCANCVSDPHLKELVNAAADSLVCDYCGASGENNFSAPVDELMPAIAGALHYYFAEPAGASVPYQTAEGGWQSDITDTGDALASLPLECDDGFFDDVLHSMASVNDCWVHAADGHWASEHEHQQLSYGWLRFAEHVKHRQRYFFSTSVEDQGPDIEAADLLPALGKVVTQVGLIHTMPESLPLYRARVVAHGEKWPLDAQNLGAAPKDKAAAGRMNPAGIPYLYVALEKETALAEVLRGPPSEVAVGTFQAKKSLRVLNLIDIPAIPSIFDNARLQERELIIFLGQFVEEISRPVSKDGVEHINYVPSQVVCEYFASVFGDDHPLDGMLYPSAVRKKGRNLVLFPNHDDFRNRFPQVRFMDAEKDKLVNWSDFATALNS